MTILRGEYTLHYWVYSPISKDESGHKEEFADIVTALLRAYSISQNGGKPTLIIYDDAVLLSGDDLVDVLNRIPTGSQQSEAQLTQAFRNMLPHILIEQLVKTVKFSHEHFGAVVVYRRFLEELYEAADQAIQKRDLELLHKITGKLAFWYVPTENDVKQWGKDFLHAYRRDAGWLRDTKNALEKIQAAAKELDAPEGSRNAELKEQILKAARHGLITHI
ncbi:MAG: hypothetical protein WAM70_11595 [Pyrinomonadaceae bacterium]